jgi:hypothetical protein
MRGSVRHHGLAPPSNDTELGLQCGVSSLSDANRHGVLDIRNENLAVTDLARACRLHDRVDDSIDEPGENHDFYLDLWNKAHRIFGATINLGWLFLMLNVFNAVQTGVFDWSLTPQITCREQRPEGSARSGRWFPTGAPPELVALEEDFQFDGSALANVNRLVAKLGSAARA